MGAAPRFRALSLIALVTLALSLAASIALRSASAHEARGTVEGFAQPIFGAEALRLGVDVALEQYDDATLDARLGDLASRGLRYVRQEFRWAEIEPERGRFDWSSSDRIFSATARHGLSVLPVLWTTPAWARAPSGSAEFPPTETAPPADVDDYARFAGAFAARYGSTGATPAAVMGYQIWDEPNLSAAWGNALVDPTAYLRLLRAAREAIHAVQPHAPIVLAGLAPTVEQSNVNLAPQTYLLKLYQLGGHQAFDVAAAKAYGFDFPPDDRRVDPGVLNFSHLILMREVMVAHGDGHKAIWATPFGWNALPLGWRGEPSIWGTNSEQQQAEYTLAAVQRAAEEWPWLGAMFAAALQPAPRDESPQADGRWGFALVGQDGAPRPVYDALTRAVVVARAAPRAQLFAACASPQSVFRTLRLEDPRTAMPEVLSAEPDCAGPNPRAEFSPGWRFGQLGADIPDRPDANVRVRFHGDELALIVRRGDYRAYTFVTIDGQPANLLPREPRGSYLIMTAPGLYPVIETVPVARGLGPGEHVAELTVDRGWNQWALIGWSSGGGPSSTPPVLDWMAAIAALVSAGMLIYAWPRAAMPRAWRGASSQLAPRSPLAAILTALVLWLTASLTWAQDAATAYRNLGLGANVVFTGAASGLLIWSPALVLSLIALIALFALIVLRLEAGLALLAFFAPFFLVPQRLFERAFSMPELILLMCLASWLLAWAGRMWSVRGAARAGGGSVAAAVRGALSRLTVFDWSVLALVIIAALSAAQAAYRTEAVRELRLVIIEPALAYLMLRTLPARGGAGGAGGSETRPYMGPYGAGMVVLDGFVLGAVAIALIGLFNYAQGDTFAAEFGLPRIKSVFGSANNDALYLERAFAVMVAVAVFGWARRAGGWVTTLRQRAAWYALAAVPVALALILSQSRGALLLGVPAALIVMAIVAGGRWRWAGLGLLALMALAFGVLLSGAAAPLLEGTRFANALDLQRGTGFFRLNLWQSALAMWRDHPVLGVGPDNFLYAYRSFYILPAAWQEPNLSHPHNVLFDFASRLGALGLVAGVGLIVGYALLARRTMRVHRALGIGCAGFLAAMLAHGLVDHAFFLVDLAFAFMLTAGVMAALVAAERPAWE